jgi:hypothetical protein
VGGLGSEIMKLGIRDRKSITFAGQVVEIQAERDRQNDLKDAGKFQHTCADPGIGTGLSEILQDCLANYTVLGEEFGEAGHEMNELIAFEHWVERSIVRSPDGKAQYFKVKPKEKWGFETEARFEANGDVESIDHWIEHVRKTYLNRLRTELIQVAAVTLAMIERLDMEG